MGRPASSRLHTDYLQQLGSDQGSGPARKYLQPLRSTTSLHRPPRKLPISPIQTESLMVKLDLKTNPDFVSIVEQQPAFRGDCYARLKAITAGAALINLDEVFANDTESGGTRLASGPNSREESTLAEIAILTTGNPKRLERFRSATPEDRIVRNRHAVFNGLTDGAFHDYKVPTLTAKDAQGTVEKAMYNAKYCFFFNADADPKAFGLKKEDFSSVVDLPSCKLVQQLLVPSDDSLRPSITSSAGSYRSRPGSSAATTSLRRTCSRSLDQCQCSPVTHHPRRRFGRGRLVLPERVWADSSRRRNAGMVWQRFLGIKVSALRGLIFCLVF